jgi:hypothetical protein
VAPESRLPRLVPTVIRHRRCSPRRRFVIVGDVAAISRLTKLEAQAIGRRAANHELSEMDGLVVQ